jgi:hypothetical protein
VLDVAVVVQEQYPKTEHEVDQDEYKGCDEQAIVEGVDDYDESDIEVESDSADVAP